MKTYDLPWAVTSQLSHLPSRDNEHGLSGYCLRGSLFGRSVPLQARRVDPNETQLAELSLQDHFSRFVLRWWNAFSSFRINVATILRALLERTTIYVLECEGGKYYVGMTSHRRRRFRQHFQSSGSAWTRKYPPQQILQEYRRIPSRFALGMEAQVTAQLMWEHGVNNVRGAMFSQTRLYNQDDIDALVPFLGHFNGFSYTKVRQVLEDTLPLRMESIQCYRCGKYGHMMADCTSKSSATRKKCRLCSKYGHLAADCPKVAFERSKRGGNFDLDGW